MALPIELVPSKPNYFSNFLLLSMLFILGTVFFVFDVSLHLSVAAGMPYVILVLLSFWSQNPNYILLAGLSGTLLNLVGNYWATHEGEITQVILTRSLALFIIWVTALLCYSYKKKEKELEEINQNLESLVQERTHELHTANDKLQQHATALESTNQRLENFAYVASHDLQEPLRKIMVFGDRLESHVQQLDETGSDYLRRMQNATQRMQSLIEGILAYSRVRTKTNAFQKIKLNELVRNVLMDLEPSIREKNAAIRLGPLPVIEGDRTQIRQVFQNIISNSLKYSREGARPVIEIKAYSNGSQYQEIAIRDNGIGFDEKYIDKIFQPFERLHTRTQYQGTGIGLTICEKILKNHGGKIKARGRPDRGATFTLCFPKADAPPAPELEMAQAGLQVAPGQN